MNSKDAKMEQSKGNDRKKKCVRAFVHVVALTVSLKNTTLWHLFCRCLCVCVCACCAIARVCVAETEWFPIPINKMILGISFFISYINVCIFNNNVSDGRCRTIAAWFVCALAQPTTILWDAHRSKGIRGPCNVWTRIVRVCWMRVYVLYIHIVCYSVINLNSVR